MATKKAATEKKAAKPAKQEEEAYDKGPLVSFEEIAEQLPVVDDLELFESLCADYKEENEKAVAAEAAKEALKPAIKELADKLGITHAGNEVMTFMKIRGKQPDVIVKEALLEMGVDMETINAATKKGSRYFYFQIVDSDAVKEAKKADKGGKAEG